MIYTVYKPTGQITKVVNCQDIEAQLSVGELYMPGEYSDSQYYVLDGEPVLLPDKPADYYVFDYSTKQWTDPRTTASEWRIVKANRKKLLEATDWTQLPDVPLATKEVWAVYRQALRDITNQPDPFNVVWPIPPQG